MGVGDGTVEVLDVSDAFWAGKSVFVTGHTGFKGGWLSLWLSELGAKVHGYSLAPPTTPSLFDVAGMADRIAGHTIGDVRDSAKLTAALVAADCEIVFHLAAQPLVRLSYSEPIETFATNVMGTANLLEAVRSCPTVRAVVSVTTDKCYANNEWLWAYRENEPLGGRDPYSASKACAEIVTAAMRDSFLSAAGVRVASARAGNVIGGGDWAADRLIPDFFRSTDAGQALNVRYPGATRPWQHVLEPVAGYLALAKRLATDGDGIDTAWNFGPADEDARPVRWILDHLCAATPGATWQAEEKIALHEAGYLKLDSSRARHILGWHPRWNLATALEATVEWHRRWRDGEVMAEVCRDQITRYAAS
ncbi:CDP-glucose 4,6-dehydratase [Polymorphobacter sp. PAMC 29334]|nr:CDP-glucose 4,6-dehydratase [Polymorphobacter sp. PAMC 29334]